MADPLPQCTMDALMRRLHAAVLQLCAEGDGGDNLERVLTFVQLMRKENLDEFTRAKRSPSMVE
jgi:hypothetical protein